MKDYGRAKFTHSVDMSQFIPKWLNMYYMISAAVAKPSTSAPKWTISGVSALLNSITMTPTRQKKTSSSDDIPEILITLKIPQFPLKPTVPEHPKWSA